MLAFPYLANTHQPVFQTLCLFIELISRFHLTKERLEYSNHVPIECNSYHHQYNLKDIFFDSIATYFTIAHAGEGGDDPVHSCSVVAPEVWFDHVVVVESIDPPVVLV